MQSGVLYHMIPTDRPIYRPTDLNTRKEPDQKEPDQTRPDGLYKTHSPTSHFIYPPSPLNSPIKHKQVPNNYQEDQPPHPLIHLPPSPKGRK